MFTSNGTLRLADINNQANYSANSIGVTLGASGAGQLGLPLTGAGVGSASNSAQSTEHHTVCYFGFRGQHRSAYHRSFKG